MSTKKYVYSFKEGNKDMKPLLGGKGAGLAEMTNLGIPVPPGFTITTEACAYFQEHRDFPEGLKEEVETHLRELESTLNKKLGDKEDPLLVSVRSGAAISMPGMMDTVLNLGLNDGSVLGLAKKSSNERFAWDSYRRFIQMFGNVVMGIEHSKFEKVLDKIKEKNNAKYDTELTTENLKEVVKEYLELIKKETGKDFPQGPNDQLWMAIRAVFDSWNNKRAIEYRRINNIKNLLGTAVNVQAMVFGNMGNDSGTGVCFTRNPSTGEKKFYGEFLMNAQGEDVVAGIRTPQPIESLKETLPEAYEQLVDVKNKLEQHYKDMQDIEFTIQNSKLYLLQTRTAKRTAFAAVKIAVDMVKEGLINNDTALMRIEPTSINQLLHKKIDPNEKQDREPIVKGLAASPGVAVGKVVFSAEEAFEESEKGEKVVLVRTETSPEDIKGMNAAQGIVTQRGGMTSHAAVVARGMGKCAVVGCSDLIIDEDEETIKVKNKDVVIKKGDIITLDGSTGEVFEGELKTIDPEISAEFKTLMEWADDRRTLGVKTNADIPRDAKKAKEYGAEGIGLCRTEHMFFEGERIWAMREMILADTVEGRKKALDKLLPMQKSDFKGLFETMEERPITIRLLDPPLHEFLPKEEKDIEEMAHRLDVSVDEVKEKIENLKELNPMLGYRGCRLLIRYPEIAEMQTRAIFEAACEVKSEKKIDVKPQVMIPLVGFISEYRTVKQVIKDVADKVISEKGVDLKYKIGTMIEVPRAALTSDVIAKEAEFFSFGTNDLTQMTLGFSRDDVSKFLPDYLKQGIIEEDPFKTLDVNGVGKLINMTVSQGRKSNPNIEIGICGEQGGDPKTIEFCHKAGLDYVSCSPYRVPIARLAAAQSAIKADKNL